jgi:hypothetical protein
MKKFLKKFFGFSSVFLIPLFILLSIYIYVDPFKVVYSYTHYFEPVNPPNIELNKDFVSTYTFMENSKRHEYNSFIFGNSRSIFYEVNDWKNHIEGEKGCFHFDASGEALYAMHKKILFLKDRDVRIKNCLIILDFSTLQQVEPKVGHLSVIAPPLVEYSNLLEFHKTFFEAFVTPNFFYAIMDFTINGKVKEYMTQDHLIDERTFLYDKLSNQMRFEEFEEMIENGTFYTEKRKKVFYTRSEKERISEPIIGEKQLALLQEMSLMLRQMKSDVKIVINPLYDQKKLNQKDLKQLNHIFGNEVYDFSGKNFITEDYKNYYEASHYRPHVAKFVMEKIYK